MYPLCRLQMAELQPVESDDARLVQSVIELHATLFHAYETGWCVTQYRACHHTGLLQLHQPVVATAATSPDCCCDCCIHA